MNISEKLRSMLYAGITAAALVSTGLYGADKYYKIMDKQKPGFSVEHSSSLNVDIEAVPVYGNIDTNITQEKMPEGTYQFMTFVEKNRHSENMSHEESLMEIYRDQSRANYELVEKLGKATGKTITLAERMEERSADWYAAKAGADEFETIHDTIDNLTKEQERKRQETEEKLRKENEDRLKEIELKQIDDLERTTTSYNAKIEEEKRQLEFRLKAEREKDRVDFQKKLEENNRINLEKQVEALKKNQISEKNQNTTLLRSPTIRSEQTYQTPSYGGGFSSSQNSGFVTRTNIFGKTVTYKPQPFFSPEWNRLYGNNVQSPPLRFFGQETSSESKHRFGSDVQASKRFFGQ